MNNGKITEEQITYNLINGSFSNKKIPNKFVCKRCSECKNSCKQTSDVECSHFVKGFSRFDYKKMIKENNTNIDKLCKKNNLDKRVLRNMLNGKMEFTWKYRYYLDEILLEKEEWIKFMNGEIHSMEDTIYEQKS